MRRYALYPALLLAAGGCHKQEVTAPQPAPAAAATPEPRADAVDVAGRGKPLPKAAITDAAGTPLTLDSFKGKPLLLNLWATWCAPCIKELPTLDALAAGGKVRVLAVSEDLEGPRVVAPFLARRGFKALTPALDTSNALMLGLKEASLPVTILYGADGRELWRVRGGMDWASPKAKALLAQAGA